MRSYPAIVLVVTAACTTLGAAAPAPQPASPPKQDAAIRGTVTGPGGKPVAGAAVAVLADRAEVRPGMRRIETAVPVSTRSGDGGTFRVPEPPGERCRVYVDAPGLAPTLLEHVPKGAVLQVKLAAGRPLGGVVIDQESRSPVAGATVLAWSRGGAAFGEGTARRATTDDAGRFAFEGLAPGSAALQAVARGRARVRLDDVPVPFPAAPEATAKPAPVVTLVMRPGGRLAGRVVDAQGKPVRSATVIATSAQGPLASRRPDAGPQVVRASDDGRFAFDGVEAGPGVRLRAERDGGGAGEIGPVPVVRGTDREDLEIRIEPGAALTVRVVDAEGHPAKRLDVEMTPSARGGGRPGGASRGNAEVAAGQIEAAGDGRFAIRRLDPGVFDVALEPEDLGEVRREAVALVPGETVDLGTLVAREGRSFRGRVADETGQPVGGATVAAIWMQAEMPRNREAKSRADGTYKLPIPGDARVFRLAARAKGFVEAEREPAGQGEAKVDFTLRRSASVVGHVLLADGTVPPSFRVKTHPEARDGDESHGMRISVRLGDDDAVQVDPAGSFRLDDVDPGRVTVEASAPGRLPARRAGVDVAPGAVVDVGTLTLGEGRTLAGRVVDARDDTPLAGAVISASAPHGFGPSVSLSPDGPTGSTGVDGTFRISGLESRTYDVVVQHPSFSPATVKVEVPAAEDPAEIVVRLGRGGTVAGMVRDANKQPVAGATILAMEAPMGGTPSTATTGPDGRYAIEKLAAGQYNVMRPPESGGRIVIVLGDGTKSVAVREGETTVVDFDDAAKIDLTGRVVRGSEALADSDLYFRYSGSAPGGGGFKTSHTDADGRYRIGLDVPGAYTVSARVDILESGAPVQIEVPDAPAPQVDVRFPAGAVSGHVVGPEGKPVEGAVVTARNDAGDRRDFGGPSRSQTGADGAFRLDGLDAGTYSVSAEASGYRTASRHPVEVKADDGSATIELRLESSRAIRGRVVDPGGAALAGAVVVVAPSGTYRASGLQATTDVNGAFSITAPTEGPVDLAAIAAGYAPARAQAIVPDPASDREVVLALRPGASLRITVRSASGQPVPGAAVTVRADPPFLGSDLAALHARPAPTDAAGATIVGPLAAATYTVDVAAGDAHARQSVAVEDGAPASSVVTLP